MHLTVIAAVLVCASAVSAKSVAEPVAGPAQAVSAFSIPSGHNLVIYRKHAEPTAWSPTVKVDGVKVGAIPNRRYTSAKVAPGRHTITLSWPIIAAQRGGSMAIEVKDDEIVHYVEVMGISRYDGLYVTYGSGLAEAQPAFAEAQIASCCAYKASK